MMSCCSFPKGCTCPAHRKAVCRTCGRAMTSTATACWGSSAASTLGPGFPVLPGPDQRWDRVRRRGRERRPDHGRLPAGLRGLAEQEVQSQRGRPEPGWGIKDKDLPDFATAARCLPLWSGGKGAPYLYDPVKKAPYQVLNHPLGGHVWDDLRQFRLESVRGYMNALAGVLKKGVADVPVVYGWSGRSALFSNTQTPGGFDGLSMTDTATGAYAFAQAEETPKTTWLIAAASGTSLPPTTNHRLGRTLKGAGGARLLRARPPRPKTRADWRVRGIALVSGTGIGEADARPAVPGRGAGPPDRPAPPVRRRLVAAVLPRGRAVPGSGDALSLGPLLASIQADRPRRRAAALRRLVAARGALTQATFPFPKDSPAVITDAAGLPLPVQKEEGFWTVPVGADPIVISHVAMVPLPEDAADAADKEAMRLLKLAKDQGLAIELYDRAAVPDSEHHSRPRRGTPICATTPL